jgi:hypothetical protein
LISSHFCNYLAKVYGLSDCWPGWDGVPILLLWQK